MKEMTKIERHKKACDDLHALYVQKNNAYGDSFGETYRKLGIISAVTRITDKYNRLVNLATHPDVDSGDESIIDTLVDIANYSLMTAMEIQIEKENEEKSKYPSLYYVGDENVDTEGVTGITSDASTISKQVMGYTE